jgi:hypothetical protein
MTEQRQSHQIFVGITLMLISGLDLSAIEIRLIHRVTFIKFVTSLLTLIDSSHSWQRSTRQEAATALKIGLGH